MEKETISREELLSLLAFLQQNNLLTPEYGHIGIKREKQTELREKTLFLRFSAAYLFFKLPPWRPEKFFEKIGPHVSWLASKPILILLALPALAGYLLAAGAALAAAGTEVVRRKRTR